MVSNEEYVKQTLIINLFYLRNMRRYARNLELSFLSRDKQLADKAANFALRCEELENEFLKYADNRINKDILNGGIFTTDYTIPLENQTIRLFGIPVNVDISQKENALTPGNDANPSNELINKFDEINKKALTLAEDFLQFTKDLYSKEIKNELFTYSAPFLINYMINETNIYIQRLNYLIARQNVNPSFVSDFEYSNNEAMRDIAIFIRSYIGPSREDIFIKAQSFVKEYDSLLTRYKQSGLTPDSQKELNNQSIILVTRFANFIEEVIQELLDSKAYFIIEPIFLDNILTNVNYFKYNLIRDAEEE
jgi:hypothetical protein